MHTQWITETIKTYCKNCNGIVFEVPTGYIDIRPSSSTTKKEHKCLCRVAFDPFVGGLVQCFPT